MEELWQRIVYSIFGPLRRAAAFPFFVQPMMATVFAVIDGLKDAKLGKTMYFWAVVMSPEHRRALLKDGWKHVEKIFILAVVLDVVYQFKVFQRIYPGETIMVAVALAVVPYIILRGPVNRLSSLGKKK